MASRLICSIGDLSCRTLLRLCTFNWYVHWVMLKRWSSSCYYHHSFLLATDWSGLTGLAEAALFPLLCSNSPSFPVCLRMSSKISLLNNFSTFLVIMHKMRAWLALALSVLKRDSPFHCEFYFRRDPGRANPKGRKASNNINHISLTSRDPYTFKREMWSSKDCVRIVFWVSPSLITSRIIEVTHLSLPYYKNRQILV